MKKIKRWAIEFIYADRWRLYGEKGERIGDFVTLKDARDKRRQLGYEAQRRKKKAVTG